MNKHNIEVVFEYGKTVEGEQNMQPNTIYIDGSFRGPAIRNDIRTYSFDHHAGCSRFATLATCEQVLLAMDLGLDVSGMTVVMNDLDADGSLSLWLLRNPKKSQTPEIRAIVKEIGFVDAHGPVRTPAKLHKSLSRNPRVPQTIDMLWDDQGKIDAWYERGDEALSEPFSFPPAPAFGLTQEGELVELESAADFAEVYAAGCVAAVMVPEGPEGTKGYTIGKRSDFVSYDVQAFLASMNELEKGWGGGSTIGGAPRLDGGKRSSLPVETVKSVFLAIARGE
ncbi:MAG: hypothetical protein GF349_00745 [Candidatus Magasanikbacteria bacterium]|nr:hypothetical protein [Candidatus Magasanikbacteria bacterium]